MCEQLGQEPDENEMPPSLEDFPLEIQEAFVIHAMLPDRWDGARGTYFGKDWSPLRDLLAINDVFDHKTTVYFLKHIESCHSINVNGELKRKQDAEKRRSKVR